jgi:competence protein ComEA
MGARLEVLMRVLTSLADRVRRSKWMPLLAKIVASFGVIAALGLVGTGLFDGWVRTRKAAAAGAISGVGPADAPPPPRTAVATETASAPLPSASASAGPCKVEGKVILNTATAEELDKLPGVGPSKALRIVELRTKLGGFKRLEELFRIKGIKRKLLEKIRPLVVLDPPADCAP